MSVFPLTTLPPQPASSSDLLSYFPILSSTQLFSIGSCSLFRASHQSSTFLSPYCSTSALTPHPPSLPSLSLALILSFIFSCQVSSWCPSLCLSLPPSLRFRLSRSGQVINMEDCVPLSHWVFLCFFYFTLSSVFYPFLSSQPPKFFLPMSYSLFLYFHHITFFAPPTLSQNHI